MIAICEQAIFCVCLKHAILLNIVLVNHIVCRYNVSVLFVTLVIYGLIHDDLYRPDTFQKLEKNPLMIMSEQSERAVIFALLRDCVRNVYVFF